jgi:hypothetical protein
MTASTITIPVTLPMSLVNSIASRGREITNDVLVDLMQRGQRIAQKEMAKQAASEAKAQTPAPVTTTTIEDTDVTPVLRVKVDPRVAVAKTMPAAPRQGRPRTYAIGHVGATVLRSALSNLSTNAFTHGGKDTLRLNGEDQDIMAGAIHEIGKINTVISQSQLAGLLGIPQPTVSGLLGKRLNTLSPAVVTALIAATRANSK